MIDAPLALYQTTVPEEWLDYNGHMSEWCYLLLVGDAADAFFRYIGIDEAYRAAGHSLYTAETHLHHLRESGAATGSPCRCSCWTSARRACTCSTPCATRPPGGRGDGRTAARAR